MPLTVNAGQESRAAGEKSGMENRGLPEKAGQESSEAGEKTGGNQAKKRRARHDSSDCME